MKPVFKPFIYPFLFLSFITLSLNFISIKGVQVSIGFLFLFTIILTPNLRKRNLLISMFFIGYVLIIGLSQIMYINLLEYSKSFLLFLFAALFLTSSFNCDLSLLEKESLLKTLKFSSVIIIIFEFLQVLELIIFKSDNLLFALDNISISTAESAERFQAVNLLWYTRPLSFFHEPSYLSSVLIIHSICIYLLGNERFTQILIFFGILFAMSITGFLFYLSFIFYILYTNHKSIFKIISPIIISFLAIYQYDLILDIFRLNEVFLEGSSGWARIVKPLNEIKYEFQNYYSFFGRALGNTRITYDNSLFVLIAYFGVLTPIVIMLPIKFISNKFGTKRAIIFTIALGNLLFLNGAILTPESMFMLIITIICIRISHFKEKKLNFT